MHKHPLFYAVRNHIVDFLVTRSRGFIAEMAGRHDPRQVPIVRPGILAEVLPKPAIATPPPTDDLVQRRSMP